MQKTREQKGTEQAAPAPSDDAALLAKVTAAQALVQKHKHKPPAFKMICCCGLERCNIGPFTRKVRA